MHFTIGFRIRDDRRLTSRLFTDGEYDLRLNILFRLVTGINYYNISILYSQMGAGILPIAIRNGKIYFLFGKENKYADTPGWSDFGGGVDPGENVMATVIREAQEELTGFLGGDKEIRALLKRGTHKIKFGNYTMFVCPMEYNEWLPIYYNNNQRFLQKHLDPKVIQNTKIFEKAEIKWVCESELDSLKPLCRSYFQEAIGLIKEDLGIIRRLFVSKKTRKRRAR